MSTNECSMGCESPPKHPGEVLSDDYLRPMGISVQRAADRTGVARQTMSNFVNSHSSMSVNMALSVSREFGGTAEEWLHIQTVWDVWKARQARQVETKSSNGSDSR